MTQPTIPNVELLIDHDLELERCFALGQNSSATTTPAQEASIKAVTDSALFLAYVVKNMVPEGKEQTIALNMCESVALWATAGIIRRTVEMGVGAPPPSAEDVENCK
jgi:hypothetical protein